MRLSQQLRGGRQARLILDVVQHAAERYLPGGPSSMMRSGVISHVSRTPVSVSVCPRARTSPAELLRA